MIYIKKNLLNRIKNKLKEYYIIPLKVLDKLTWNKMAGRIRFFLSHRRNRTLPNSHSKTKVKLTDRVSAKVSSQLNFIRNVPIRYLNNLKQLSFININKSFKERANEKLLKKSNFVGIYYAEHKLTVASMAISNDKLNINQLVKVDIPPELIGDYIIEKVLEVKKIVEDIITIFKLNESPIILILGSSYFTLCSFSAKEVAVFSENEPKILAKSPYLPLNTSLQHEKAAGDKLNSYNRVVYAEKNIIESWIKMISMLSNPILCISASGLQILEGLSKLIEDEIIILCDIEESNTTVFIQESKCALNSKRLPFGSSIYCSDDINVTNQYFERLIKSIEVMNSEDNHSLPPKVFITGKGLDILIDDNYQFSKEFETKIERLPSSILEENILLSDSVDIAKSENKYSLTAFSLILKELIR